MPQLDRTMTVGSLVLERPATAKVFQKNRIDYCCGGGVTVTEACAAKGLDPEALWAELDSVVEPHGRDRPDPRSMSTPALIAYIVDRHHGYLRATLPYVAPMMAKVARVHGEHNPKLTQVATLFAELSDLLEPHLDEEEGVLFPVLTKRDRVASDDVVRKELDSMSSDHRAVGSVLERLRAASDDYTVPPWGCGTYRALFSELLAIETDVLAHVHLENHVLAPRFAS